MPVAKNQFSIYLTAARGMEIFEKQKLIAEHSKGMRANFFWSDGLELLSSPLIENVPSNAWADLPQYPNIEKWMDKLFAKCTKALPHMHGYSGIAGAIASAVIAKTNDSQEIMDRATRLANLEWQLQHLTYWSAPTTHEPNKKRETFGELNRQRELLRESAIEGLCLYQCGAHDYFNDFERYKSYADGDVYCAAQYEAAFNKMMAWAVGYCSVFDKSESRAVNRSGKTPKNNCLTLWLAEKLSKDIDCKPLDLWQQISKEKVNATETPDCGEMWISGWSEDKKTKGKLHITDRNGKKDDEGITYKRFSNILGDEKKLNRQ